MTGARARRWGPGGWTGRVAGDDRGSVSILFAAGLTAILMVMGVSVDGGGRLREAQLALDVAAEAARTGGQQINFGTAINGGPKTLDPVAAQAAVTAYLTAAGATGPPITISPDGQHITVTVTMVYRTEIISLLGFDTLTVSASATAALLIQ